MVFSNKVRFPGSWEKEAAPDFVGVAKITVPDPSAPSAVTCKWPRLTSPSCTSRCEVCPTTAEVARKKGNDQRRRETGAYSPRCGDGYEVERQKDHGPMELSSIPWCGTEIILETVSRRRLSPIFHDLYVLFRHRLNLFSPWDGARYSMQVGFIA